MKSESSKFEEVEDFVDELARIRIEYCFNPFSETCVIFDRPNAAEIRRANLTNLLRRAIDLPMVDIWVGRDLGHRGGRRTGVALIDEVNLDLYAEKLGSLKLDRSTFGEAVKEQTSTTIFRVISKVNFPVFTWNVFPLHPHEPGKPFTNRLHTKAEGKIGLDFLRRLYSMMRVRNSIAIGNDALHGISLLGVVGKGVRHPSYGGQNQFLRDMGEIYGFSGDLDKTLPLFSGHLS